MDYLNTWTLFDMPVMKINWNKNATNYVDRFGGKHIDRFDVNQLNRTYYGPYPQPSRSSADTVEETVPYARGFSTITPVPIEQKIPQTNPDSSGPLKAQQFLQAAGAYSLEQTKEYANKMGQRTFAVEPTRGLPTPQEAHDQFTVFPSGPPTVSYTRYDQNVNGVFHVSDPYKTESSYAMGIDHWLKRKDPKPKVGRANLMHATDGEGPIDMMSKIKPKSEIITTPSQAVENMVKENPKLKPQERRIKEHLEKNYSDLVEYSQGSRSPAKLLKKIFGKKSEQFTEYPDVYLTDAYDPTVDATKRNLARANQNPFPEPTSRMPSDDKSDPVRLTQWVDWNTYIEKDPMTGVITNMDKLKDVYGKPFDQQKTYIGEGGKVITGLEFQPVEITPRLDLLPQNHPSILTPVHVNAARYQYNVKDTLGVKQSLIQDVLAYRAHDWNSRA